MSTPPVAEEKPRRARWRVLRSLGVLLLTTLALLVLMGLLGWIAMRVGVSIRAVDEALTTWRPWFLGLQLAVIGFIWWKWDALIVWICRHSRKPDSAPHLVLFKMRHRIGLALLILFLLAMEASK